MTIISPTAANGVQFKEGNLTLVKKSGQAGEEIKRHNHPGHAILFQVVTGQMQVFIDDVEHVLTAGQVLPFDGQHYIHANYLEDSVVYVTLVKQ